MKKSAFRNTEQGRRDSPAAIAARKRRLVQKRKPRGSDGRLQQG